MLKAVTVTNFKGESLRMELSKPEDTGMLIYNIEGLGSPTISVNSTEMATVDGARFNSARAQSRNIVFTIAFFDHDEARSKGIETSRHKTYKYFPTKKPLTLKFETDERTVAIDGYVESNEPTIFSKDEYAQISIMCPEPYFRSINPTGIVFTSTDPYDGFEFPFENNSVEENLISMGEIKDDKVYDVVYPGDADVGMLIIIHAKDTARGIEIYNADTREHMWIDDERLFQATGSYISEDDIITISTVKGNKYATLQRGVKVYNIINSIGKDSDWIQITQGDNIIGYTATNGIDFLSFRIEYYIHYEGV